MGKDSLRYAAAIFATAIIAGCASSTSGPGGAATNPVTRTFASVSSGVSSTVKKGVNAVTPQAKVVPPADPLALSHKSAPPGADFYVSAAEMHEKMGAYDEAVKQYEKALAIDSKNFGALVGMAHLYDRQEKLSAATPWYVRATQYHPQNATGWNDLGLCYARQGHLDESLAALERAIELKPDSKLYHNNVATVLVEMGRHDEAYAHLSRAHGAAAGHYNIGYLLQQRGHNQEAAGHFRQAVSLDPSLTQANDWLAQLDPSSVEQPGQAPHVARGLQVSMPTVETQRGNAPSTEVQRVVKRTPPLAHDIQATAVQPAQGNSDAPVYLERYPSDDRYSAVPAEAAAPTTAETWQRPIQLPDLQPAATSDSAATPPVPSTNSRY